MDWARVGKTLDILTAVLAALAALGCGLAWGLDAATAALAGALLLWLDIRILAQLVVGVQSGAFTTRLLVFLVLPLKFAGLIAAMYVAVVVLELDPYAFVVGVSVVVVAIIAAGALAKKPEEPTGGP